MSGNSPTRFRSGPPPAIRPRVDHDVPAVAALLQAENLPSDGLERTEGWVAEAGARLVGHVAIERGGGAGVLRSLVVAPALRSGGLGGRLMDLAEAALRPGPIILKTDTIAPWVLRRGYRPAALGDVPPGVRATTQFEGPLCASSPVFIKEKS